ncbi:hypothetical protein V1460_29975 [Streptomyces sp. SCSIO 30461]|uniref:hypothetical protein n=1 Tax=Streptomyces sp. SCSIO 30461 TaxID=3118085 RepID=UPI0030D2D777
MLRLRRLRLENIGHPDARFSPTLLDFTDPHQRVSDAIVWLRNGGGKSSLLALFFSLLLPGKTDFIGYAKKKGLIDYVLEGKPAHVVAEWEDDSSPFGGPALITGAVYQWPDGHRPASDDDAWDKLQRTWYTLRPTAETSLTSLPVHTLGGWRSRDGYVKALTAAMAANHRLDLQIVKDGNQTTWETVLSHCGLDPRLLHVQRRMNVDEGAITELFQFDSHEGFLELLIDLVVDPTQPAKLRDNLKEQAERLAQRPARELEMQFLTGALIRLRPLQQAVADTAALDAALSAVHGAGKLACSWISDRHTALTAQQTTLEAQALQAREQAEKASQQAKEHRRRADTAAHAAALLTTRARRDALRQAEAGKEETAQRYKAWTQVHHHLDSESLALERAELTALLARRAKGAAPLRKAMEAAGAALHAKLTQIVSVREAEAAELTQLIKDTDSQVRAAKAETERHTAAAGDARSAQCALRESVERIDGLIGQAREDGLLERDETPDDAAVRWAAARDRLDEHLAAGRSRLKELSDRLLVLEQDRDTAERQARTAAADHDGIWDRWTALEKQRAHLVQHPRLVELAQVDIDEASSGLDLNAAGHRLLEILEQEIAKAHEALISEELATAADRRAVACLNSEGFLPMPLETERALEALRAGDRTLQAVSGLQFLRGALPRHQHAAAIAQAPDVVGGIVILGELDEQDLRRQIAATGVATRSVIAVCDSGTARARLTGESPAHGGAVFPVQAAALHKEAAEQEHERLSSRIQDSHARCRKITSGREADQTLLRELSEHLRLFGPEPRQRLQDTLEEAACRRDTWEQARDTHREQHRQAQKERDGIQNSIAEAASQLAPLGARAERSRSLATESRRITALTDQIRAEQERQHEEERGARRAAAAGQAAEKAVVRHRRDETICKQDLTRHRSALRKLLAVLPDAASEAAPVERASLEALEERFTKARTAMEAGSANTQLRTDLAVATRRLEDTEKALDALDDATRALTADLATRDEATDPGRRDQAIERAEEAAQNAATEAMRCEVLLEQAEEHESGAARQAGDTGLDVLHEYADPATAEAAAHTARQDAEHADHDHAASTAQHHTLKEQAGAAVLAATSLRHAHDALQASLDSLSAHWSSSSPPSPDGAAAWLTQNCGLTARDAAELTEEQAHRLREALHEALTQAQRAHAQAARKLGAATRQVHQLAADRQYISTVDAQVIARLSEDGPQLHALLPSLIPEIELRERRTKALLDQLAEDQLLLVQQCVRLVKSVVATLHQVARHSKLPAGLGAWSGVPFLTLKLSDWGSEETLTHRLSTCVDSLVSGVAVEHAKSATALPRALDLAKCLTLAALGGASSIKAKVLKPHPVPVIDPVDVTKIRKFSGGELLTVSVLLYCCLAQVRAANRYQATVGGVGTLVLDNPMGKSNYVPFLDLQRAVAATHGVQLIYTTGVEDLDAVSRFPLILRLRNNAHDARSGHRLVQLTERYGDTVADAVTDGLSTGIRTARLYRTPFSDALPDTEHQRDGEEPDPGDEDEAQE